MSHVRNQASLTLRPLQASDNDDWVRLWNAYLAFYQTRLDDTQYQLTWQRLCDPQLPIWAIGAFDDERMVGLVHYLYHLSAWTDGGYCYLQDLYVDEKHRRLGFGRRLIEAVMAQARQHGADRVYWLTQEDNQRARRLYDQLADLPGFIQYRRRF